MLGHGRDVRTRPFCKLKRISLQRKIRKVMPSAMSECSVATTGKMIGSPLRQQVEHASRDITEGAGRSRVNHRDGLSSYSEFNIRGVQSARFWHDSGRILVGFCDAFRKVILPESWENRSAL